MAVFTYKGLNAKGAAVKGVVDSDSVRGARQKLRQQGVFPTAIAETIVQEPGKTQGLRLFPARGKRISSTQLAVMTRQFATLVAAGMPIVDGLKALGEQVDQTALKGILADVCDKVNEGSTLAASMREYPGVFPRLYVNMVASGEVSGSLDLVLERLADLLEAQSALQRKVLAALTYPILMLVLCFGVILLLLGYVVPQITKIFQERKATLPLPTRIIITASNFVRGYWPIILVLVLGSAAYISFYRKTERGRKRIDSLLLQAPLFGNLRLKISSSRFARNLGMMLQSGIEVLTALGIVKNILGNVVLEEAVEKATDGVREGSSLAGELNKSQLFPRLLIHMVAIGERTGQLESMLIRAAHAFESEVESTLSALTSILEPVLIIFLALIVGGILASVLLPMLEMTSLIRR